MSKVMRARAAVLPGVVLCLSRLAASIVFPVYDDAYITFRHSLNLAAGEGLTYQSGESVLSTTAPGFAILGGLFHIMNLPVPFAFILLNIAADLAVLYLTLSLLPEPHRQASGLLFSSAFAASPHLARICVGGMESDLFLALSILAIALVLRSHPGAALGTAVLACALRPEGAILLCLLLGMVWSAGPWERAARDTILAIGIIAGLAATMLLASGHLIPQSVIAKWRMPTSTIFEVLAGLLGRDAIVLAAAPFAAGAAVLHRRNRGFAGVVAWWASAYLLFFLGARPKIWSWYGIVVGYASLALASAQIASLASRAAWAGRGLAASPGRLALLVLPLCLWCGILVARGPSTVTRNVYRPTADWCRSEGWRRSILAHDIGVIGYHCGGRIYDTMGLAWREAPRHNSIEAMIVASQPEFLYLNRNRFYMDLLTRGPLARTYLPVRRFSPHGQVEPDLSGEYPTEGWVQDYVLFRRLP